MGIYLNDYYMAIDAAHEDHDIVQVQQQKAIKEYGLKENDPLIKALATLK